MSPGRRQRALSIIRRRRAARPECRPARVRGRTSLRGPRNAAPSTMASSASRCRPCSAKREQWRGRASAIKGSPREITTAPRPRSARPSRPGARKRPPPRSRSAQTPPPCAAARPDPAMVQSGSLALRRVPATRDPRKNIRHAAGSAHQAPEASSTMRASTSSGIASTPQTPPPPKYVVGAPIEVSVMEVRRVDLPGPVPVVAAERRHVRHFAARVAGADEDARSQTPE